jgi:hypothetical protein
MSIEVYLDNPGVRLHWDSEARWIYIEYRQWFTTAEVNIGIEAFLQALRDHRAAWGLSDSRKRRVLQPDAQKALVESWIPQAAALGLKRLAIVLPTSQVALSTVESLMRGYRKYVETEAFATVEEAAAWLSVGSAAVIAQA